MKRQFLLLVIVVVCLLPWIVYFWTFRNNQLASLTDTWGQFGSYISGVVTAMTIPLTLYFVYRTYQSQQNLELLTLENQKANDFEKYFFELLRLFNDFRLSQIKFWTRKSGATTWHVGTSFFIEKRRLFQQRILAGSQSENAFQATVMSADLSFEYYFRTLNELIKWTINSGKISKEDQRKYLTLIKNSLTNDEKFFIHNFKYLSYYKRNTELLMHTEFLTDDIFNKYHDFPSEELPDSRIH